MVDSEAASSTTAMTLFILNFALLTEHQIQERFLKFPYIHRRKNCSIEFLSRRQLNCNLRDNYMRKHQKVLEKSTN